MRLKDALIIWTVYLDKRLTKKEGRRVSKNEAVRNPSLEEIEKAARQAGYIVIKTNQARYPSSWWMKAGYIAIKKVDEPKTKVLKKIAKELRRMRGGG